MPTRRLLAYWLMILLPSLAIGGLALHYIRHEKDLLAAQQRASISDQGLRAAEDILLLVENLQYGLVLSLENLPDDERATALRKLHRTDPLVRQVFLFNDREQRVVQPDANEMERPEVQAFIRRYDALFTGRIPWFPGSTPGLQGAQPADEGWFARHSDPASGPIAPSGATSAPATAAPTPLPAPVTTASQVPATPPAPNAPSSAELGQNVIIVQLDDLAPAGGDPGPVAIENTTSASKKVDVANSAKTALFRQFWNEYSPNNLNRQQQQRLAESASQVAQQQAVPAPAEPTVAGAESQVASGLANAPAMPAADTAFRFQFKDEVTTRSNLSATQDEAFTLELNGGVAGTFTQGPAAPEKPMPGLAKAMAAKPEELDELVIGKMKGVNPEQKANLTLVAGGTLQLAATDAISVIDATGPAPLMEGEAVQAGNDSLASADFAKHDYLNDANARFDDADHRQLGAAHPDPASLRARATWDGFSAAAHSERAPLDLGKSMPAPAAAPMPSAAKELGADSLGDDRSILLGGFTGGSGSGGQRRFDLKSRPEPTGDRSESYLYHADLADLREGADKARESARPGEAKRDEDVGASALSNESEIEERLKQVGQPGTSVRDEIAVPVARPQVLPSLRSGWRPWYWENSFHLLGFVQDAARGETFGVELELLALLSRLPAALDGGTTAAFVLRDQQGGIYFQSRPVEARETPVDVFNLGPSLAFYELAVFPADPRGAAGLARTSFLAMALLVGAFLVSIASGGGLLIAQARASWREAMQKTSFVSNVSHELKTPLTTLRMYTEMLRGGKLSEDKRAQYLDVMLSEGERLSRLVGNVLDFSRLEQGRKKYQMESLDLGSFTARVVEASRVVFERPELCLTLVPASGPVPVRADPDALEQVLLNLLDNAAKYGGAGGEIRVAVSRRGGRAMVDVLDRGPGVPAEHRARIFDKFHRVDESLTAEQGGCGLGLSIARRLARDHGGDITCEERPGGGAAFRLQLPAAEEARA